ncbi:Uu.00g010050.m01.CDS01 [Anthostomella pinea]|uniref:Uu.00g010050.m01.CDS01 n=1 Tax=Anthostomella pinea TaxID=933095 RepID=A0AAI8VXH6_9PEZI|nr:Uu.00g010050.m01.CDS01 [Anthostomella pinea]
MLEKTAATLEPCGLQRVLPGATKSFRSTRQLHTTFWQHGAADVELTSAWQALMHGTFAFNMDSASDQDRSPALAASSFLLDFLYPSGTIALMRRLTPSSSDRTESFRYRPPFTNISPRLYTSSIPRQRVQGPKTELPDSHERNDSDAITATYILDATVTEDVQDVPASSALANDATSASLLDAGQTATQSPHTGFGEQEVLGVADGHDPIEMLDEILISDNLENADRAWYHYKALDDQSQMIYLSRVLVFLSRTGRLSDSWKISELFHKLDPSRWDSYTFVAGVTAEVNLQNSTRALEVFVTGLQQASLDLPSFINALDWLLATALKLPTRDFLWDIWSHYPAMAAKWDFDGVTSHLKHVALVPGLAEKAISFQEYRAERLDVSADAETDRKALDTLQRLLVRRALIACADAQVMPLLNITKDPLAFEEFLRPAADRDKKKLATTVYQVYRDLPGNFPSHNVLYEVFKAYKGMNAPVSAKIAGIELLWGDWHRFYGTPSRRAYQRYLAFFASKGDKERVHAMWIKYIELFHDDQFPVLEGSDTFTHLLQVHAVNGEADETKRIFDDLKQRFHFKPNVRHWNILLNAYVKAGDYDAAIATFDSIKQPDQYSYGTLMQMAGGRGDLGFTVDLYRRARNLGVLANDAMLSSLIDGYCQNDHFQEAEDVCVRAVNKGIIATWMWNKLLYYNAMRRDLASINSLLNVMAEKNVPYNQFTYQQLLLGLSLCRQSQHALRLLAVALKDHVFEVTHEHFQVVMGALLITGEPGPVMRLHKLMTDYGFQSSSGTLFRLSQALTQYRNLPPKQRSRMSATQWLGESLRSFYHIYGLGSRRNLSLGKSQSPKGKQSGELLRPGVDVSRFGTMVYMFTQLKDFVRSKELIDLYRYIFQGREDDSEGVLPVAMLNSIMVANLHDKRYDRVKATWRLLFNAAKTEAKSLDYDENLPHTPKISPKYRYILSGGLRVMQELLFIEEDFVGIQEIVKDVRTAGFEVDSKNWNYHVQILVQLKQYKEAFTICEKLLMPNWTGWFVARTKENVRNKIPLDVRRKGSSPRYLRPVATTLYHLAHGYMELDRLGPWSAEAGKMAREIDEECMQVVRAIKSMIRVHSDLEYDIFGPGESPDTVDDDELDGGGYDSDSWEEKPSR